MTAIRRSVAQLQNQTVTVKTIEGAYTGTLDLSDDNGVWIAFGMSAPLPAGAPARSNMRIYFTFAQMIWLASVAD